MLDLRQSESSVLAGLAVGLTRTEIAGRMGVQLRTVHGYISAAMLRNQLRTVEQMICVYGQELVSNDIDAARVVQ